MYPAECRIPVCDETYDLIVSLQTLEHLPDPEASIREWHRVLKIDATCLITTNFFYPLHGEPFDFYRFTKDRLPASLERNGFHVSELETRGGAFSLKLVIIYYRLLRFQKWFLAYSASLHRVNSFFIYPLGICLLVIPVNILFLFCFLIPTKIDSLLQSNKKYIGVQARAKKTR
jgi:SAM-dependent methyltransferase